MPRRLLVALTATAVSLTAMGLGMQAQAAPAQPCSGQTCVDFGPLNAYNPIAQGATGELDFDINVSGGVAKAHTFTAHQSAGLTADPTTVRLDGTPIPVTAVTVMGSDLTVDLSALPTLNATDHNLTFAATMSATTDDDQTSAATFSFDDAIGGPVTTASTTLDAALDRPDFAMLGQPPYGTLVPGSTFNLDVNTYGPTTPAAQLVIELPTGVHLVSVAPSSGGAPLSCTTAGSQVTCDGSFSGADLAAQFTVASDTPIGTKGNLVLSVVPTGITDATPADNTLTFPLVIQGTVALKIGYASPAGLDVVTGTDILNARLPLAHNVPITVTVTNNGPDIATGVVANLDVSANHDTGFVVSYPAGTTPGKGFPPNVNWSIGTLAVGQTVHTVVTVRSTSLSAVGMLLVNMTSDQKNTLQCFDEQVCLGSSVLNLKPVAATVATTPTPTPSPTSTSTTPVSTTSSADPTLAATGAPVRAPLVAGLLTLLLGGALMLAGRRRRLKNGA